MTNDKNEIVEVKPISPQASEIVAQFQLAPTDAEQIVTSFAPTTILLSELEEEFRELTKAGGEVTAEACAQAKTLRLKFVKIRTQSVDATHKKVKAPTLLRAKAIDGMKNILLLQLSEKEEPLMEIEKHFENIEKEKREKAKAARIEKLNAIGIEDTTPFYLEEMTEETWEAFYNQQRLGYEAAKEAEEKAKKEEADEKLHAERKNYLVDNDLFRFLSEEDRVENFGTMKEDKYKTLIAVASKARIQKIAEDEKLRKDNEKLAADKKRADEKAIKDKAEADAKIKEANDKAANDKAASDAAALKAKADADAKIKEANDKAAEAKVAADKILNDNNAKAEAAASKKVEEEKAKKNKAYINWLEKNGATNELVAKGGFFVQRDGNTFTLFKAIDKLAL